MLKVRARLLGLALLSALGCGDDDDGAVAPQLDGSVLVDAAAAPVSQTPGIDAGNTAPVADAGDAATVVTPVLDASMPKVDGTYLLSVIVFGPDNDSVSTYVSLVDSLDITSFDTKSGIEFGGQANVAVYGGKVFISDGESPIISRYRFDKAAHKLVKEGSLSFAKYGSDSVSVDDTVNTFVSPTKAYLMGAGGLTVIWNPSELTLSGEIEARDPIKDKSEDLSVYSSSGYARGNRLYRTFYWLDWSTYTFPTEQYFAVYDTEHDTLLSVTSETRCPALSALISADENGTAYFSNWFYNLASTLQSGAPSACALRLKPGSDALDPDWKLEFPKLTGGHEGAQLSYTQNNQALFAAFHQENFSIQPDTSPYDIVSSENWEVWSVDLGTQQAKPVAGIERLGAQQTVFTLDGRTFVFAPNQDFDLTKVYEVVPNGTSRLAFSIQGWSRAFLKIE